ncbi:uncharacterized protein [Ambystoma mexicanum]|uniref:uncharacterized protein n=1 Tax=Ambystoma mexicanum TaxID=8296 RepID=UPI0037E80F30
MVMELHGCMDSISYLGVNQLYGLPPGRSMLRWPSRQHPIVSDMGISFEEAPHWLASLQHWSMELFNWLLELVKASTRRKCPPLEPPTLADSHYSTSGSLPEVERQRRSPIKAFEEQWSLLGPETCNCLGFGHGMGFWNWWLLIK